MIRNHDRRHLNLASLLALDLSFVRRAADERDATQDQSGSSIIPVAEQVPQQSRWVRAWAGTRFWQRKR